MTFPDHCAKLSMLSPTGLGIRNDSHGSGYYRAKRGTRLHYGDDYICKPGQVIVAPMSGKIVRVAYPYRDKQYQGIVLENEFLAMKLFYFEPYQEHIGKMVLRGQDIGIAQDISLRYGKGMIPHIHAEIFHISTNLFVRM